MGDQFTKSSLRFVLIATTMAWTFFGDITAVSETTRHLLAKVAFNHHGVRLDAGHSEFGRIQLLMISLPS